MKQRNRARSSSLFLLELIIAILFFSACAAVCVQFFVKSHTMSQDSKELNFAVNECTTLAEIIQSSDTESQAVSSIKDIFPNADIQMDAEATTMGIYFDENFKECTPANAKYIVNAGLETEHGLICGNITAGNKDNAGNIYELEVKHNEKR
ncbi:MAG: hypothetical protein MJ144_02850 [Clostridia bacterium]|nr:hypothetical protein [Clostridia bacterium]